MDLRFDTFGRKHFPEYRSWFEDPELNERLGPMDDAWLEAVMTERNGKQYAVFDGDTLVAVVGITLPDDMHSTYYLTDFAVKPSHRQTGIGSRVLEELLMMLDDGYSWKTFIDAKNPRAKAFFEKNGWTCVFAQPNENGMYGLERHR